MSETDKTPLVVDLDGTLIRTDLMWESVTRLLRRNPFFVFAFPYWWMRGRAYLKMQLAAQVQIDPATLPWNETFLAWLRQAKQSGRKIVLATAADLKMAEPIAAHLGIFDEVLASDGKTNLRSENKLRALTERYGERGFDYAGNSRADFAVWRGARQAVVVNASESVRARAAASATPGPVFAPKSPVFRAFIRCLRPHQWFKNLIIFVPIVASHKLTDGELLLRDAWAFGVFCVCASGVYVLNDLMDLDTDRKHATKKNRPLASGQLPLPCGLALAPALLLAGLLAAAALSWPFAATTAAYLVLTTAYSWYFKRLALLDVFCLAGLYTIRLVAGHAATGIAYSAWLLMFSMFIFLSLALVKRYVELFDAKESGPRKSVGGRGYAPGDLEIVASLGTGSGYLAALVLALYVNSQQVVVLYRHPNWLLLVCPLLLYWIGRVWLLAHRGQLHEDPVLFAIKDPASYLTGLLALGVLWAAAH